MKQLFKELIEVTKWCSCCPHIYLEEVMLSDEEFDRVQQLEKMSENLLKQVVVKEEHPQIATIDLSKGIEELHINLSKELVESVGESTVIVEPEKSENDEWLNWENEHELYMKEFHAIRCPYIRKKGLEINIDREFIIPDDDKETLRILDKLSQCYTQECRFNEIEHFGVKTLNGMIRVALAKIDFALLEQGKDFGHLMRQMYFPYYERSKDLHECGYSWELISYYLDKYNIKLLSNEEYDALDDVVRVKDYASKQEYKDALADGKCDKSGKLLVRKAAYTRYAAAKYNITSGYKEYWTRFDCIFSDDKGKPIPYKHFLQSYRDQGQ